MTFDPKVRKVIQQIEELIQDSDIQLHVFASSGSHSDYLSKFHTSTNVYENSKGLIKSFENDDEGLREAILTTSKQIAGIRKCMSVLNERFNQFEQLLVDSEINVAVKTMSIDQREINN